MSTKKNTRITKQVRVGEKAYKKLKSLAKQEEITMSKMIDEIISSYLYLDHHDYERKTYKKKL